MNSEVKKRSGNQQMDEASSSMIYQGVSLTQAVVIFKMDLRDIKSRIQGRVAPCGHRAQNPIYQIRDLAPFLVRPAFDIDEFIQRMSIADLPPLLKKEYWAAQRSRQLYEIAAAELWPTGKVVDAISLLLKTIRMALLQAREAVERETELTPRQRTILAQHIDTTLEDTHDKTLGEFTKAHASATEADGADAVGDEEL